MQIRSVILFLALFMTSLAQANAVLVNSMPTMPQSAAKLSKSEKQDTFSGKISELVKINGDKLKVPAKPAGAIRVVSYNVHNWAAPGNQAFGFQRDPKQREKEFERIKTIIANLGADIVVFQEARLYERQGKNTGSNRAEAFKTLGFTHSEFIEGGDEEQNNGPFGNLIIAKMPFKSIAKSKYKGQQRAYIKAIFDLSATGKKDLVVYASHLQNANSEKDKQLRLSAVNELTAMALADKDKNILVAADFNESQEEKAPALLAMDKNFKTSYLLAGVSPGFTAANGTVIDYIYTRLSDLKLLGCFLDFTVFNDGKPETGSDHLPVVIDLK